MSLNYVFPNVYPVYFPLQIREIPRWPATAARRYRAMNQTRHAWWPKRSARPTSIAIRRRWSASGAGRNEPVHRCNRRAFKVSVRHATMGERIIFWGLEIRLGIVPENSTRNPGEVSTTSFQISFKKSSIASSRNCSRLPPGVIPRNL